MKYADIVGLYDHFQPVYDIANEVGEYWKHFIPNERFYDILQTTLNALESGKEKDRRPIWMQGSYGTGKTHAMAVIKHLLWDDTSEIEDYLEGSLNHAQLREKLRHFRKQKRIFPVILKGVSNITNNRTFALVIEQAVRTALQQHDIHIPTQTDFEKLAAKINDEYMNWEKLIAENVELSCYLTGKDDLLNKIQGASPDIESFEL